MDRLISFTEKAILLLVACFTVYGVAMEMLKVFSTGKVELTDLLLMFIYAEVLGMVGARLQGSELLTSLKKKWVRGLPTNPPILSPKLRL